VITQSKFKYREISLSVYIDCEITGSDCSLNHSVTCRQFSWKSICIFFFVYVPSCLVNTCEHQVYCLDNLSQSSNSTKLIDRVYREWYDVENAVILLTVTLHIKTCTTSIIMAFVNVNLGVFFFILHVCCFYSRCFSNIEQRRQATWWPYIDLSFDSLLMLIFQFSLVWYSLKPRFSEVLGLLEEVGFFRPHRNCPLEMEGICICVFVCSCSCVPV